MPLDPLIADFLAASSQADAPPPATLAEMRAATEAGLLQLQGEMETNGGYKDYVATADDGHGIALRVYTPAGLNAEVTRPAMLFAHGGGWCLGSLALYDRPCQALANATGRVIVSVDYRLAPEHPFPRPLEDVYQALCWVHEQAPRLGIDSAAWRWAAIAPAGTLPRRPRCWHGIAAAHALSISCCCIRR